MFSFESKGLLRKTSAYELHSTFMNLSPRLDPEIASDVCRLLAETVNLTTQDPWMHDFHQVWSEAVSGNIADPAMELCRAVLLHDPKDPVSLYHLAQALRERRDPSTARIILRELTTAWPRFGDGQWELASLLFSLGEEAKSSESLRAGKPRSLHWRNFNLKFDIFNH